MKVNENKHLNVNRFGYMNVTNQMVGWNIYVAWTIIKQKKKKKT